MAGNGSESPPANIRFNFATQEDRDLCYRPDITPEDGEFRSRVQIFAEMLSNGVSVRDIITNNFSIEETTVMFRSTNHRVMEDQIEYTRAYRAILLERSFDTSDATKLALAYFGLSIEPFDTKYPDFWANFEDAGNLPTRSESLESNPNKPPSQPGAQSGGSLPPSHQLSRPVGNAGIQNSRLQSQGEGQQIANPPSERVPDLIELAPMLNQESGPVHLYGYRGRVSLSNFRKAEFVGAVKRLLGVRRDDRRAYRCQAVVFDTERNVIVSQTDYMIHFEEEDRVSQDFRNNLQNCSRGDRSRLPLAYFVRLHTEPTPTSWEPSVPQFQADLARVVVDSGRGFSDSAESQVMTRAWEFFGLLDSNVSYLAFPRWQGSSFSLDEFTAQQYHNHIQSTLEVAAGFPLEQFHHAMFKIERDNDCDSGVGGWYYGAMAQPRATLEMMHPSRNPGVRWALRRRDLNSKETALVLPNFFPKVPENAIFAHVTAESAGTSRVRRQILSLLASAFGSMYAKLYSVWLLPGVQTIDNGQKARNAEHLHEVFVQDNRGSQQMVDWEIEAFLASNGPFVMLHPVWLDHACQGEGDEEERIRLPRLWTSNDMQGRSVELPRLDEEFPMVTLRGSVQRLMELNGVEFRTPGEADFITLRMVRPPDMVNVDNSDFPVFALQWDASDEEWYRIRSQITACNVVVEIVPWEERGDKDWRLRIARNNQWGARAQLLGDSSSRASRDNLLSVQDPRRLAQESQAPQRLPQDLQAPDDEEDLYGVSDDEDEEDGTEEQNGSIEGENRQDQAIINMRNVALGRDYPCPFLGCGFRCRFEDMRRHIEENHMVAHLCHWCRDSRFGSWTEEQRCDHLRTRHEQSLIDALGITREALNQARAGTSNGLGGRASLPANPRGWADNIAPVSTVPSWGSPAVPVSSVPIPSIPAPSTPVPSAPFGPGLGPQQQEARSFRAHARTISPPIDPSILAPVGADSEAGSRSSSENRRLINAQLNAEINSHSPSGGDVTNQENTRPWIPFSQIPRRGYSAEFQETMRIARDALELGSDSSGSRPHTAIQSPVEASPSNLARSGSNVQAASEEAVRRRQEALAHGPRASSHRNPKAVMSPGPVLSDPDFVPGDEMYCSRCLRKVPKKDGRSDMNREQEMKYHTDLSRCCKIRNGLGDPKNLPNTSGWIKEADVHGKIQGIKRAYIAAHPDRARTMYPTNGGHTFASLWRLDPNNENNREYWNSGASPAGSSHQTPSSSSSGSTPRRKAARRAKAPQDPTYRPQHEEDLADDLEPDFDDTRNVQATDTIVVAAPAAPVAAARSSSLVQRQSPDQSGEVVSASSSSAAAAAVADEAAEDANPRSSKRAKKAAAPEEAAAPTRVSTRKNKGKRKGDM